MNLIVTLDHFFQDWQTGQGALWLCVQPHVQTTPMNTAVSDWIRQSDDGSRMTYTVAALSSTTGMELTPVPFPDAAVIEVRLYDSAGTLVRTRDPDTGTPRDAIINDLGAAFAITDANAFAAANRDEEREVSPSIPPQPVYQKPFALGYNMTLRDALNADLRIAPSKLTAPAPQPVREADFRKMLSLAFWGGLRRTLPASVSDRDKADWMRVDQDASGLPIANHHGLCGLLFRLATQGDVSTLAVVRKISITIRHAAWRTDVAGLDSAASLQSLEAFFSTVSAFPQADPGLQPKLIWNEEFASRAYVVDDGAAFIHSKPGAEDWFIRPAARKREPLDPLRRLTAMRVRSDATVVPDRLLLRPHLGFAVKMQTYRRFPVQTGKPVIMELAATPEDAPRLARFLKKYPSVIAMGRFFNENGAEVAGPNLVGSYHLPWDAERHANDAPTVLYHGLLDSSATTLRLPIPDTSGSPLELTATKVLPGGQPSPFGERWEVDLSSAQTVVDDFDALLCVADPAKTAQGLADLVASAVWPGEVTFEFAQSVSSIEGNVAADYDHPPEPKTPAEVTASGEYAHDLINFNALNVYYGWNEGKAKLSDIGSIEHYNRFSELYPVCVGHEGVERLQHHFVFRDRPAASAPPEKTRADQFFEELYSVMPDGRRVGFDIEHTYGTRLGSDTEPLVSAHFDFPLLPPARIPRPSGKLAPPVNAPAPLEPFLRCAFEVKNGEEHLRLTFDRAWLHPGLANDPVWGTAHVQAWRSVAELAFAKEISLTAQCMVFDFTIGAKSDDPSLAAALKKDNEIGGFPRDCTSAMQAMASNFLNGNFATFEHTILLSSGSEPRIGKTCHVVEFGLKVERTADRLPLPTQAPEDPSPWSLLRFKTDVRPQDLYRADGQATNPVTDRRDMLAFSAWLSSLRVGESLIQPDDGSHSTRTSLLKRLLSGRDEDVHEWIAPEDAVEGDGRTIAISACPVGFRPILIEPVLLGAQTSLLLSRFMEGLASILDCAPVQWANDWTSVTEWRRHFEALQSEQATIIGIIDKAVMLLHPLPDPTPGPTIDPVVQDSVAAWNDPSSGVKQAVHEWTRTALLRDPSLFASTKALLYTRLWGDDGNSLSADFFRFQSVKQIRDAQPVSGGGSIPAVIDDDIFSYREGLGSLAGTNWFGFVEILDDLSYDSQFAFAKLALTNVESFLDRAIANELGKDRPVETPMPVGRVHVPDPIKQWVPLAARAPLVPPVSVYAGKIDIMQKDATAKKLAVGQQYDRQMFLNGRLERAVAGSATIIELVGMSDIVLGHRDRFEDDFVLTSIFAVRGDEEANGGSKSGGDAWTKAWDNDLFYLDIAAATNVTSSRSAKGVSTDLEAFFTRLAASPDPRLMTNLQAGYDNEVLRFVQAAMIPAPAQSFSDLGRRYARLSQGPSPSTLKVELLVGGGVAPKPGGPLIEVFAFRAVDAAGPPTDQPHIYLLVNWLCKTWVPQRLSVEQTRNVNVGFAAEFGSSGLGLGTAYQPVSNVDLYNFPAIRLQRRRYALADFVDLMLAKGVLETLEEAAKHDLSITVSHDQVLVVEGEYLDAAGKIATVDGPPVRSALPLLQIKHAGGTWSGAEVDLTSVAYLNLVIDFQWSSRSNLQFFRLQSRRAVLA